MSADVGESVKGVEGSGGGGGRRRAFADRLAVTRGLLERKKGGGGLEKPSDYEFFRRMVLDTDWDETVLREKLLAALMEGKNLNEVNPNGGANVLQMACSKSSYGVVRTLLRCKANPHQKNNQKRTALHYAVINKDPKVVELVLEYLDNPMRRMRQRDSAGFTPFEFACSVGNGPVAKYLFDRYPTRLLGKTSKKDNLHRSILHLILTGFPTDAQLPALKELLVLLIHARPQDVWAVDNDGRTPLAVHVSQHYRNDSFATFSTFLTCLSPKDIDKALYVMFHPSISPVALSSSLHWKPEKWLVLQRMMTSALHVKYVPAAIQFVTKEALLVQDGSGRSILHWLSIFGYQPSLIAEVEEYKSNLQDTNTTFVDPDTGVTLPRPTTAMAYLKSLNGLAWHSILKREPFKQVLDEMTKSSLASSTSSNSPTSDAHDTPTPKPDDFPIRRLSSQFVLRIFDNQQITPIHVAAKYNNTVAIEKLFEIFGEEIKTWKDSLGRSALHTAAEYDAGEALLSLRKHCAWPLDELDKEGYTPYMRALKAHKLVACEILKVLGSTSEGLATADGTSIETLVDEFNQFAIEAAQRKEAREAKRKAQNNSDEEEDWSSTEHHSDREQDDVEEAETGSTGSVEIKSDPGSEGSEEDESDSVGTKPYFKPKIKHDSEYDEEGASKNGPQNGTVHNVGGKVKFDSRAPVRAWGARSGARISKDDEYDKSDSDEDDDGTGSDHSFEEKSTGSSPPSSTGSSPRLDFSSIRSSSPPPPLPSLLSPISSPSSSPRQGPFSPSHLNNARRIDELELAISSYQSQLSASQNHNMDLERANRAKDNENADLNSQLRDKDDLLSTQHQEISDLLKSSRHAATESDKWQEKAKTANFENEALKTAQSNLEGRLSEATSNLDKITSENGELKSLVESLKAQLDESKTEISLAAQSDLEGKLSEATSNLSKMTSENSELKSLIESLKTQLEESKTEISLAAQSDLEGKLSEATSNLAKINSENGELKSLVESLKTQLEESKTEMALGAQSDLEGKLSEATLSLSTKTSENDELKSLVASLKSESDEAKNSSDLATKSMEDAQALVNQLQRRLDESEKARSSQAEQLAQQSKALSEARAQAASQLQNFNLHRNIQSSKYSALNARDGVSFVLVALLVIAALLMLLNLDPEVLSMSFDTKPHVYYT